MVSLLNILHLQEKDKGALERTHIEYEKVRDKYEKLTREFERLKQTSQVNLASSNLSINEKNELERMREALDKALQVTFIITFISNDLFHSKSCSNAMQPNSKPDA